MKEFYGRNIHLIQMLMRGCLWYALLILIGYQTFLKKGQFHPYGTLLIFPVMMVYYLIHTYIKNQKLKLGLILVFAIALLAFTEYPKYFVIAELVLHIGYGYNKQDKEKLFGLYPERWLYGIPGIVLFLILLILHRMWSDNNLPNLEYLPEHAGRFMVTAWIVYLILYVINGYMKNFYEHFSRYHGEVQREVMDRAKRSNSAMIVILSVCGLAGMAMVTLVPAGFYQGLLNAGKKLLALLLGLFLKNIDSQDKKQIIGRYLGTPGSAPSFGNAVGGGDDQGIVMYIVQIALIALVIYTVIRIYKKFLVRYHVETDTAEFASPRGETEISYEKKEQKFWGARFGNSNRDKIRKMYYQMIGKRYSKQTGKEQDRISDSHTPKELSQLLSSTGEEKRVLDALTVYYEKARFSDEDCTEEDVETVKNML